MILLPQNASHNETEAIQKYTSCYQTLSIKPCNTKHTMIYLDPYTHVSTSIKGLMDCFEKQKRTIKNDKCARV